MELVLLFDVYGEMLTDKQRKYFDLYYNEDLTLSEISENAGITKQGVHDALSHAEKSLRNCEEKLGLIAKSNRARRELNALEKTAAELSRELPAGKAKALAEELCAGLERFEV